MLNRSLQGSSTTFQCSTAADRAAREAATRELMERRAASTDEAERQELLEEVVELNLEMARGIARRFRGRGAEADDLEQVAYLGLVKAAHHYRLEAETPFIGFAIPTIRGEVKRYFRDCAWTVRIRAGCRRCRARSPANCRSWSRNSTANPPRPSWPTASMSKWPRSSRRWPRKVASTCCPSTARPRPTPT
ncbi:hypothetical protein GCM10029976_035360 [Kribbella albertanoniae]